MGIETIDEYEIEYAGMPLAEGQGWGAYVTIYGPSSNPMHRNSIYPTHRVAPETNFPNEQAAEIEARKAALDLLAGHHAHSH
jgi:hypothetical protein